MVSHTCIVQIPDLLETYSHIYTGFQATIFLVLLCRSCFTSWYLMVCHVLVRLLHHIYPDVHDISLFLFLIMNIDHMTNTILLSFFPPGINCQCSLFFSFTRSPVTPICDPCSFPASRAKLDRFISVPGCRDNPPTVGTPIFKDCSHLCLSFDYMRAFHPNTMMIWA